MTAQIPARRAVRTSARDLAQIAVFAALIAALTLPGAIPVGIGVPITLQTLGVMLAGAILGARKGTLAVVVYVVLGLAGLPILAGGAGGLGVLVGPSGGYLLGFIPGAFVIGWLAERLTPRLKFWTLLIATVSGGIVVVHVVGVPWLAAATGMPLGAAFVVGSLPFLIGDVIKAVIAALVAAAVHRAWPGLIGEKSWPWRRAQRGGAGRRLMPEIVFEGVSHRYDRDAVLTDVSLTLTERRIGVIGANGSGKSTLARLVNGLVTPTAGRVLVDGLDVARHGRDVRRRVGFVFTNPDNQIVMPTVREDVAFSLRRLRLPEADASARVEAALERFGLTALGDRAAHRLSGGQKQLLALAAVLVAEPATIVADEPTTLLDARNSTLVERHFAALDEQLILVTHRLESVVGFDRVLVVEGGRIVADDVPEVALDAYRSLLASDR